MRKKQIGIIGGFYSDPNLHWSRQDTLNWIPVRAEQPGTLTPWQLRDAPGVKPLVRITRIVETEGPDVAIDVGPIRGMRNVEGKLFVVAAQTLYQISNNLVAIPYGTVPGVGRVSMAHNQKGLGNELLIVNGSAGYVFNTNTLAFAKITDEGYPGAFIADYVDQYLAQVEPQGRFWFHSELADAFNYNTLDRYEAEGDPDRIVSLIVSHREVIVFGSDTTEPYVNTGGQTGTFERASNTVIECGCSAKFSPRKLDNSVFWLDDKRIVRRLDGYTPVRISTEAIDAAFSECSDAEIAQAYGFSWETSGHKVYYITVPGRFTFGYDVLTGLWHRRSTWGLPHWDVVDCIFWNGAWITGSARNGRMYQLDPNYKLDACDPLVRKRTTGKLWDDENEMSLNNVELKFNTGGPVSVCVPFPAQPEGPTASGAAPDGAVGVAWGPFSYSATGGTPPYKWSLRSGSIAPGTGPLSVGGTIAAGTPTQTGAFSRVVRVTDSNGLFDDHEDMNVIAVVSVALYSQGGLDSTTVSSSGTDWTNPIDVDIPDGIRYMIGGVNRLVAWTGTQISVSTNLGDTWTNVQAISSGGLSGVHWKKGVDSWDIVAAFTSGIWWATAGSTTFTQNAAFTTDNVTATNTALVGLMNGSNNSKSAPTPNGSVTVGGLHGLSLGSFSCIESDGTEVRAGARTSSSPGPVIPKMVRSLNDGTSWTDMALPSLTVGSGFISMKYADGAWVAGTSDGKLLYDHGSGWQLSTDIMDAGVTSINFNGAIFMACCAGSSGQGQFKYSADRGVTWQTAPHTLPNRPSIIAVLAEA